MADPRITQEEWAALSPGKTDKVGGDRHARGAPRYTGPWKCPACGQENTTRMLEEGCEHCGSGAPGRHVGADPRAVPPSERALIVAQHTDREVLPDQQAFEVFLRQEGRLDTASMELAWRAFNAGRAYEQGATVQQGGGIGGAQLPLAGTKEQRTILAALDFFIANVLSLAPTPEEVRAGEWCSAAEARELIASLERRH